MRRRTFLLSTLGAALAPSLRAFGSLGTLAYVEYGGLSVRTLPDGEPRKVVSSAVSFPRFSRSGKWISYIRNDAAYVVSIDGKEIHKVGDEAKWSPVADELWVRNEATDALELRTARVGWGAPAAAIAKGKLGAFSPDGSEMIYVDQDDHPGDNDLMTYLCRVKLKDGAQPQTLVKTEGDWTPLLWTHDGKSLVYWGQELFSASEASDGDELFVMPADGGKPRSLGVKTLLDSDLVALSPKSNELGVTAGEGRYEWTNKRLAVVDVESANVRYLMDKDTVGFAPTWSPDGARIAYSAGPEPKAEFEEDLEGGGDEAIAILEKLRAKRRIWIRDRAGEQPARMLTSDERFHDAEPLWSADGSHILFTRSDSSSANDIHTMGDDRSTLWLVGEDGGNPVQVTGELYIDSEDGGGDERLRAFDWLR